MIYVLFVRTVLTLLFLLTIGGVARSEVIQVDKRLATCVQVAIPSIIAGDVSPLNYVNLTQQAQTALGGAWRNMRDETKKNQALADMREAVSRALVRGVANILEGISGATAGFTDAPIAKNGAYTVNGVLTAQGSSSAAGSYNFTATVVVFDKDSCHLKSLTVALLASDTFDLGRWIRGQPEIAAVLKKYDL